MIGPGDLELRDGWRVAEYSAPNEQSGPPELDGLEWLPAEVPGAINYDVQAKDGVNPFASTEQATASQWVARSDWIYQVRIPDGADVHAIEFDGIDTYADVWLNDALLGRTSDSYREYVFPVPAGMLRGVGDRLVVHVKSHFRMIEPQLTEARQRIAVQGGHEYRMIKSLVRRYQRNSFSNSSLLNLGVHVLGIGIYKPVRLRVGSPTRIGRAHVVVEHLDDAAADLRIEVAVEGPQTSQLQAELELVEPDTGRVAARASTAVAAGAAVAALRVDGPKLWWPRGYGEPYLYRLVVRLTDADGVVAERRLLAGLRTVELVEREDGRPTFHLRVNGQRVYVRGTNFVPIDYLKVHGEWSSYERLLTLIDNGGYNLVRLWGGGAIEDDRFFQRCNELGIMLWQDLFLHSNTYPDYDPQFVAQFGDESRELLLRMRENPALVLVCGGNEQQEGWDSWNWKLEIDQFYGAELIYGVGADVSADVCPELPYIANSPHGRPSAQSPVTGDTHTWGNFVNATKDPQFVTETCWSIESYSRPQTLHEAMGLDVEQFAGRDWPTKWTRLTSRPVISKFPYSGCHDFTTLRDYLRSLEIEQAMADYQALSLLRLRSSSGSGIVYWSLNKGGPLFQFGSIDYHGRPMMSYYVLKRVFADVAVNVYRDIDDINVVASNVTGSAVDAVLRVRHLHADGDVRDERECSVTIGPGEIIRLLRLPEAYRNAHARTGEVWHAQLSVGSTVISSDTLYLCPLADVQARGTPEVVEMTALDERRWSMELHGTALCKWVMLESDQRLMFSDNYFPLMPGERRLVEITDLDRHVAPPTLSVATLDGPPASLHTLPIAGRA